MLHCELNFTAQVNVIQGVSVRQFSEKVNYRFEQDESLTKSATHSENAIKSL